ncbi:hypothetical protein ABE494_08240 [Stenotrophomonas lactitubi]|uniref:hypothetical protein n=1 Tax=Stenotrophomonas lactitubi TaxID=2045214 RepID=UPI0032085692
MSSSEMEQVQMISDQRTRLAGAVCVVICIAAWSIEWSGYAYVCPYCRVQRSVIGILGLMMLVGRPRNFLACHLSLVMGGFAFVVAATQHFMGWKMISAGTFEFSEQWYLNSTLLSAVAMIILSGQVLLLSQGWIALVANRRPPEIE